MTRRWLRRIHDDAGISLPELLVGTFMSALVMTAVVSAIFTSNDLRLRVADRSDLASDLAVLAMRFDRDATMATAGASARSQTTATSCDTAIDLGFLEDGGRVRYRTVAGSPAGPQWLQRISGAGSTTVARNVSGCTWRVTQDGSGRPTIRISLSLSGPGGESVTQVLRGAPRLW